MSEEKMSLDNFPGFFLNFSESGMGDEEKHFYRFKTFRLNIGERQLLNNSTPVALTPKAFDVLAVLVKRSGHLVEKDELLKLVWADTVVEEANVARIVHTLRKVLAEDENGDKFIETVAKRGYRFVAKVSEVCEPAAPKSETERQDSLNSVERPTAGERHIRPYKPDETLPQHDVKPKNKSRTILVAGGLLSGGLLIVLLYINFESKSSIDPNKVRSIAVLPVNPINMSNRDELYEIGIADSLIHELGSVKGFIVRPLSAIRKYHDLNQDPVAAGKELKVDYVLASNYQLARGKIKVTAELYDVSRGQIEETYKTEIDAGDPFGMQNAIATEVGKRLQARFAMTSSIPTAKRGTTNEEAYRLYLQGKLLTMKRDEAAAQKAVEYLAQAIQLDPNFARAYAGMAHAYQVSNFGHDEKQKVREFINKALSLDNNLAEAYVARADSALLDDWDFPSVEKNLLRAIALEPNNDGAHWLYALLLSYRGQFDEAMGEIETALAIDPGALVYMRDRGRILYYAHHYDKAIEQLKRVIDLDQDFDTAYGWLCFAYDVKGDYAAACELVIKRQRQTNPDQAEIFQKAYETAGWQGLKRKEIEFLKLYEHQHLSNFFHIAQDCALLGERDQAIENLNKAFEKHEWGIIMLKVAPTLDSLRGDPRFDHLVGRVGLK